MADVLLFKPQSELDAERNVRDFVDHCRDRLTVFGRDLPFDEPIWDVTAYVERRGKTDKLRIYFSDFETAGTKGEPTYMQQPFLGLAKAYMRYQQGAKPTTDLAGRLAALRAVDKALRETSSAEPHKIDAFVVNRASQLIAEHFSAERAYRVGQQLEMFSNLLDQNHMVVVQLRWRNPIKRPSGTERIGEEFDKRRQERLPSAYVLDALAQAYRMANDDRDVIPTSIAAIMCASPDRISEVVTLKADCEHSARRPDGTRHYGLRFYPAKDAPPQIKWIIPSMVDLVEEAVARLRERTEGARRLANWYERNPKKLYLPVHLEHVRGMDLSKEDLAELIWGDKEATASVAVWLKTNNIVSLETNRTRVRFSDFEKAVIRRLPRGFPVLDKKTELKYSEALCVTYRYQLHDKNVPQICFFRGVSHGQVSDALGGTDARDTSSVFDRMAIEGEEDSRIRITSHQFRHYLNTLARHGGLDELDIAKWSGRKDLKQNRAYDHVSARDKLALIRDSLGDDTKMFGPLGWAPNVPSITRDEFANLVVTTAHTTEFGYCIHDYVMSPCQQHTDCLNCRELVCIKGDETRSGNLRKARVETERLLALAEKQSDAGVYGANRWVEHQRQTLDRLNQLCDLLDNPMVQNGAVIQLKYAPTASRIVQAAEKRGIDLSSAALLENAPSREIKNLGAS